MSAASLVPSLKAIVAALLLGGSLAGCSMLPGLGGYGGTTNPRQCLMRAMYFESNRSSEDGMFAVGTVVMNRLADARYPKTVCGVVGQKNQFAPGVLTRQMQNGPSLQLAGRLADRLLAGARHPGVRGAMHFHQAGLRFPYGNMHYVLAAGGNEFYLKR